MAKFHPKNYSKNNTPTKLQKIGDALLLIGAVGGAVVSAPVSLPVVVTSIAGYMLTIGAIGKVITKFFGE